MNTEKIFHLKKIKEFKLPSNNDLELDQVVEKSDQSEDVVKHPYTGRFFDEYA
jgi:hypothetical protein